MKDTQSRFKNLQVSKMRLCSMMEQQDVPDTKHMRELNKVRREIDRLKRKKVVISEHAILRYLERVRGIDMTTVKGEILSEKARKLIGVFRNCAVTVDNGVGIFTIRVVDNVVTTVIQKR